MADDDSHLAGAERLETIPSIDEAAINATDAGDNNAALRKLTNGPTDGEHANGASGSDLETGEGEKQEEAQAPQRSTWKITLIMSSLCVSQLERWSTCVP